MKKLMVLTVVGTVDTDVGVRDLKQFVIEALSAWGGQKHPDDPLFDSMSVQHCMVRYVASVEDGA